MTQPHRQSRGIGKTHPPGPCLRPLRRKISPTARYWICTSPRRRMTPVTTCRTIRLLTAPKRAVPARRFDRAHRPDAADFEGLLAPASAPRRRLLALDDGPET